MEQRDCADCTPRPEYSPPPPDPSVFGPWFEAAYRGFCPGCGDEIEPGDTIRANGRGGYICQDCGSAGAPYEPGTGHAGTLRERYAAGRLDTGWGA